MNSEPSPVNCYLTDFGLARSLASTSTLTRTGELLGTPATMAPEQVRGDALTTATDVWGLGATLYEAIAGRPPFGEGDDAAVLVRVLAADPSPVRRLRPDVPASLEQVLRAALAKPLARRIGGAEALRDDLDRVLRGERPLARPPAPRGRRASLLLAAVAAGAAALVLLIGLPGPVAPPSGPPGGSPSRGLAEELARRALDLRVADPASSAGLLARALALEPGRHGWRVERGWLLATLGLEEEAAGEWAAVPAGAPERPAARLALGVSRMLSLRAASASAAPWREDLKEAAQAGGPESAESLGALAVGGSDWPAAREALRGATSWVAAYLRGYSDSMAPDGDRSRALRELDGALAAGLRLPGLVFQRGVVRSLLRDDLGAEADFEEAARLLPWAPEALVNLGVARLRLGKWDAAVEEFSTALEIRPGDPAALAGRGEARRAAGRPSEAVADFDAALAADPDRRDALLGRAQCREALGDAAGAREDLDRAVRAHPADPEALWLRGNLRAAGGEHAGAVSDYTGALARNPALPGAHFNRANSRAALGEVEGALADYAEALRLRPDDVGALVNRGNLRAGSGDAAGAEADLRAALRLRPDLPEPHACLAGLLAGRGDRAGAAAACRGFLRAAPDHPRAAEFRAFLARLEGPPAAGGGR
ncbi:MAG: tetratricopeptide repeat protein [Planctomycetales bacterium]|nr:tetratricopeptide repeat protein [Planctomycetales bacterium]